MANRKEVTLPNSGDVFTIKKPGPLGLSTLLGGLPSASHLIDALAAREAGTEIETDEAAIAKAPKETILQMVDLVCACCVKPKLTRDGAGDTTSVDDIEWGDFIHLFNEVYRFSGFEEAVKKVRPSSPTAIAS